MYTSGLPLTSASAMVSNRCWMSLTSGWGTTGPGLDSTRFSASHATPLPKFVCLQKACSTSFQEIPYFCPSFRVSSRYCAVSVALKSRAWGRGLMMTTGRSEENSRSRLVGSERSLERASGRPKTHEIRGSRPMRSRGNNVQFW